MSNVENTGIFLTILLLVVNVPRVEYELLVFLSIELLDLIVD